MKLWVSGEVDEDVAEPYRKAAVEVRNHINAVISEKAYGPAIENWDVIGIVLAGEATGFPEVRRYKKRSKSVEVHLNIDHAQFTRASAKTKKQMVFSMVMRSLAIAKGLAIKGFAFDKFEKDLLAVGTSKALGAKARK